MPMAFVTPFAPEGGGAANVTLRTGMVLVGVAKDKTLSTVGYNGQVPGPLFRRAARFDTQLDMNFAFMRLFEYV